MIDLAKTPAMDVAKRLAVPLACGHRNCDKYFGVQPFPQGTSMQEWELLLVAHFSAAHHGKRKLREASEYVTD